MLFEEASATPMLPIEIAAIKPAIRIGLCVFTFLPLSIEVSLHSVRYRCPHIRMSADNSPRLKKVGDGAVSNVGVFIG